MELALDEELFLLVPKVSFGNNVHASVIVTGGSGCEATKTEEVPDFQFIIVTRTIIIIDELLKHCEHILRDYSPKVEILMSLSKAVLIATFKMWVSKSDCICDFGNVCEG